ncbi:hypothetical protein D3C77_473960 [compost metagenome]
MGVIVLIGHIEIRILQIPRGSIVLAIWPAIDLIKLHHRIRTGPQIQSTGDSVIPLQITVNFVILHDHVLRIGQLNRPLPDVLGIVVANIYIPAV